MGNGIVQLQADVTDRGFGMAACALDYATLLLARHGKEVAEAVEAAVAAELPGGSDAASAAGRGSGSGGGNGSVPGDGGSPAAAAAAGSSGGGGGRGHAAAHLMATPWLQLLLQDMGLMGLLGAVLQLWAQAAWAQAQGRDAATACAARWPAPCTWLRSLSRSSSDPQYQGRPERRRQEQQPPTGPAGLVAAPRPAGLLPFPCSLCER